jgi:CAAX protease family protein
VVKNSTSARSPLSPKLWPDNAFVWWQSLLLAVVVLVALFVALAIVVGLVVSLFGLNVLRHPSAGVAIVIQLLGVYAPVGVLLVIALPLIGHRPLRALGLRLPTGTDILWGLVGAFAMWLITTVVGVLEESAFHTKVTETAVDMLKATHGPMLFAFAAFAAFVAPFFEELVFRGFLFNAILRYTPPAVAAVLSGVLFGAAHYDAHSAAAVVPLAAAGVVLGAIYYRTGSLAATVISHGTFNLFAIVALVVFHQS